LAERDPVLARYRVDRALAALSPPLARALASLVPDIALPPAQLAPAARAIVRAAAWTGAVDPEALVRAIARSAVATLAEQLFARSVPAAAGGRAAGVARELRVFSAALVAAAIA
jgi:hypothetical protein